MHRIVSWLFTIPYIPLFFAILCFFQPLQIIALSFGYRAHKFILDLMNLVLIINFRTVGTRFLVSWKFTPRLDKPLIIVSNHQSMYDIPFIIWIMRRYHPKFIAKKELGRWIPSISFALRNMGSVLIDRSDQSQAITAIEQFAQQTATLKHAAVIFPEGTRARDGVMKNFKSAGLITLMKNMPDADIIPIAINGSWELVRYNLLPVPFGRTVTFTVLPAISAAGKTGKEVVKECETVIRKAILQPALDSSAQADLT
jgi:1-acyl-sn-glycerol-3-phosphate acyltransferase